MKSNYEGVIEERYFVARGVLYKACFRSDNLWEVSYARHPSQWRDRYIVVVCGRLRSAMADIGAERCKTYATEDLAITDNLEHFL